MTFCQDCSVGIPDPANSDPCSRSSSCTVLPPVPTGTTTTSGPTNPPPTTTPAPPCVGDNCSQGVPAPPPADRCNNPQNRAPQPAPQTTLNPKAGATDFERLLHMSILFYEAQVGFKNDLTVCLAFKLIRLFETPVSVQENNQIATESHGEVMLQWTMVATLAMT